MSAAPEEGRLVPYALRTERLHLRAFEPADAEEICALTARCAEHLARWMPWAHDLPHPLEETVDRLREWRADFDRGRDFHFSIRDLADDALVGALGLHARVGPGGLEVGYWIDAERTGRGYATEAAGAATCLGIEHRGAARIEIRVQPGNGPSLAVPRKLGFLDEGLLRKRVLFPDGEWRDSRVFTLFAEDLAASPAGAVHYRAFDVLDRPIPATKNPSSREGGHRP